MSSTKAVTNLNKTLEDIDDCVSHIRLPPNLSGTGVYTWASEALALIAKAQRQLKQLSE